jgi:hypothetical protein
MIMHNEEQLRREAIGHIMKSKKIMNEFKGKYPVSFLNKLFGIRYNLTDPIMVQVRDYCKFQSK